jgi:hypothetical protein
MKTENEILYNYINKDIYRGFTITKKGQELLRDTYDFKRYVLFVRIEEFKTELKNHLPKFIRRFIK